MRAFTKRIVLAAGFVAVVTATLPMVLAQATNPVLGA
jgi:hypothetical protein